MSKHRGGKYSPFLLILLPLIVIFFVSSESFAISVLSTSNGVEIDKTGFGKITLLNTANCVVAVRVFSDCPNLKAYPRMFDIPARGEQVVKFMLKQRTQEKCKVSFEFEESNSSEQNSNVVRTHFIISLPVLFK